MGHRLKPLYFGGFSQPLFGCFHPPSAAVRDCGLILCSPLGHEYIQFHRALRQLALLLADAGFAVLRFDFRGCGDSKGDHDSWRIGHWIEDIEASIEELRQRAGVRKIGLVGTRLGATLAVMLGSNRDDVDALVLWDPVIRGRAYVEELKELHGKMESYAHVTPRHDGSLQEVLGFPLPDALIADLGEVDLLTLEGPPARRVLVIESNESVGQEPLRERLEDLGLAVELERHSNPHLWAWIEDFGKVHVPHKILQAVVSWLSEENA